MSSTIHSYRCRTDRIGVDIIKISPSSPTRCATCSIFPFPVSVRRSRSRSTRRRAPFSLPYVPTPVSLHRSCLSPVDPYAFRTIEWREGIPVVATVRSAGPFEPPLDRSSGDESSREDRLHQSTSIHARTIPFPLYWTPLTSGIQSIAIVTYSHVLQRRGWRGLVHCSVHSRDLPLYIEVRPFHLLTHRAWI